MAKAQESLSVGVMKRIDAACDRFEADWKAGKEPKIETHLGSAAGAERAELLRLLLKLELELQGAGKKSNQATYEARFPGDTAIVQSIFRDLRERTTSQRAAASGDTSVSKESVRSSPARTSDEVPKSIGRFEILSVLGQGAFGRVYKARDPKLDREVAIKVPLRGAFDTPEETERFLREARAAATLHHPNVCAVHEIGEANGMYFIVMAYIEGATLSAFMKKRKEPMVAKQAALIIRKLAFALGAAHAKGIVHRDLKPANIVIERERKDVVIMDFGLARHRKKGDAAQTREGVVMGTPAYMSPEQARGDVQAIGPASDIYSVGVILYEMLAGRTPFSGSVTEVLGKLLHVEPEPPSKHRPGADPQLEAICMKAMAKDLKARYSSMKELVDALDVYLKGSASSPAEPQKNKPAKEGDPVGLTQVAEVLSAERKRERAALEETLGRHTRNVQRIVMAAAGLLGFLILVSGIIMFFFRTPNTLVQVTLITKIDQRLLDDQTIVFFFDDQRLSKEDMERPINLTPGRHVLQARRGEVVVQEVVLIAGGEGNNAKIDVSTTVEYDPSPKKSEPPKKTIELPTPVAHWTFDGPPDSLAVDRIGKIKGGKIVGDVKQVAGKIGKAAEFPGGDKAFIEIPNQAPLNLKRAATLAGWVMLDPGSDSGGLIRKSYVVNWSYNLEVTRHRASFSQTFPTGERWGTNELLESPNKEPPIQPGAWTHIAGIFDGAELRLHVNGQLVERRKLIDSVPLRKSKIFKETGKLPTELQQSVDPLYLGWGLKGLLDDVMIFDVALTPEQVAKLAETTPDLPTPVAHWTFDGPPDSLAVDKIGKIKPGIIVGDVKQVAGKIGKAAEFPGTNKVFIEVPHQPLLTLKKQATLACWVKFAADTPDAGMIHKWYGFDSYSLSVVGGKPGVAFGFPTGEQWGTDILLQHPSKPEQWTHVVGVFDGTEIRLHINGRLVDKKKTNDVLRNSKMFKESGRIPAELQQSTNPLQLGWNLKGALDDVMIFDVALTPEQVEKLAGRQTTSEDTDGFVKLFNGKDLTGWKTHPDQPGGWSVEDGLLTGRSTSRNHLFSEAGDYADFHLRAECRTNRFGNSGIFFRTPFTNPDRRLDGYEAQIIHEFPRPINKLTGSLIAPSKTLAKVSQCNIKPYEWFVMEVIAQGKRLVVKVNGIETANVEDAAFERGHLALQAISDADTKVNTLVQFRTIEVRRR